MTSLQQQLSSIRAQSTQELNLKAQKVAHSKSLIFPPAEAASQSLFDIHQICVRGFKELCKLDRRFDAFAATLFSDHSMDVDRTQMSEEANKKLDTTLESFLSLCGPLLQLRDAQCAVEWLVRRFRVHEYNTSSLILTFLPYHDTNLFAVMLQLVPAPKLPPVFDFMRPYISARTNFKRPILVREASRRPALLRVLNQYILEVSREGHQADNLIGLWVDVSIQALNSLLDKARSGRQNVQNERQNETLLDIVSILRDGLLLNNSSALTLGCYALSVFVARKAVLDDQWLDSLMVAVAGTWNNADPSPCLVCLAALCEERSEKRNKLPKAVVDQAAHHLPELTDLLGVVSSKLSVNRLAYGIALGFLEQPAVDHTTERIQYVGDVILRSLLTKSKAKTLMIRSIRGATSPSIEGGGLREQALSNALQSWAKSPVVGASLRKVVTSLDSPRSLLPADVLFELGDQDEQSGTDTPIAIDVESNIQGTMTDFEHLSVVESTFFNSESSETFETLRKALASHNRLDMDARQWTPFQQMAQQAYTTFIIRIWCSSTSPLTARQSAIRSGKSLLLNITESGLSVQALLPFFLCGLLDSERRVRQTAADAILEVLSLCRDEASVSKAHSAQTLGMELVQPSLSDTKSFLRALSPHLEACVIDAGAIPKVINRLLAGRSDQLNTADGKASKDLKSVVRASISNLLASCAAQSKLLSVQLRLFHMLPHNIKTGPSVQERYIYPSFRGWIQQDVGTAQARVAAEDLLLSRVNESWFELLRSKDSETASILLDIIEDRSGIQRQDLEEPTFRALLRLYGRTEAPARLLQGLMKTALDQDAKHTSLQRRTNARGAFLTVHASTATLNTLLSMLDVSDQLPDRPSPAKRRRMSKTSGAQPRMDGPALQGELDKQTLILEKIEASQSKSPDLLSGLFQALAELMRMETATETKLDYLIQLVIRSLNTIIHHLITDEAPQDSKSHQSSVRMDTLVECLRNSSSRGSQNDILSLVSKLAIWNPELVLHSVMPIFTFIGKHAVRQGDDYTAHVIGRTVETVIPPLATSLRKTKKSIVTALSEVLQSFAAAYEHIPSHRRLPLFGLLVKQLGPEDSMFAIIVMLVDRQGAESSTILFLSDLLAMFGTEAELSTFNRCFDLLLDVHAPNPFASRRTFSENVFNIKEKSPEQLQDTISNVMAAVIELLQRSDFRNRVARLLRQPSDTPSGPTSPHIAYSQLLSRSINLIQVCQQKPTAPRAAARQALTSVMKLVPVAEMLPSMTDILDTASDEIKITALRALEEQIQIVNQGDSVAVDALLGFVNHLCDALRKTQEIELKQMAISCIDQITEKFGKRNTKVIDVAAHTLAGEAGLGHLDISLQIMALLTLASMVDVLREEFVPLIPRVLQQAYPILEMSAGQERYGELRSAVFAVVNAIIECLPQMLSEGDIDKALKLCHKSAAGIPISDDSSQRQELYRLAARFLPAETCFSAALRTLPDAIETGSNAFPEHLQFVLSLVQRHTKRTVREHSAAIFHVVAEAWTLRRLQATTTVYDKLYDYDAVDSLQQLANDIAMSTINKLNDDTLRPHFVKLVEWATEETAEDQTARMCNVTSLFSFLRLLNDKLKSLVTTYAGYYLHLASETLSSVHPTATTNITALHAVLAALASNFAGDESDYWQDPQHFDAIVTALLEQIPRFALHDPESLATHVFPAIRDFASAAYSADKRTQVNSEVLKLLRHNDAKVRLAAVQCQREMLDQVGEEWVTMVSQMMPFINEVQEDDDDQVEAATRHWIQELEAGLGESMAAMLQ